MITLEKDYYHSCVSEQNKFDTDNTSNAKCQPILSLGDGSLQHLPD